VSLNEKIVQKNYNVLTQVSERAASGDKLLAKMWNKYVTIEDAAIKQIRETASMPFVKPYIAVMPDSHYGLGATVGSVVPTVGAVMPSCVGVDIGCGMMAVRTNLKYNQDLIDAGFKLNRVFEAISEAVPHGRTNNGGPSDRGAWGTVPDDIQKIWDKQFRSQITGVHSLLGSWEHPESVFTRHPGALSKNTERHLGTLGTGNHFIEVCTEIDNPDSNLWVVIHSGSRGFGNRIGTYFTKLAGDLCKKWGVQLPNKDLGYLPVGTPEYDDYLTAVQLAQKFAWVNREIMMNRVLDAIGAKLDPTGGWDEKFTGTPLAPLVIHMHHNYAEVQGERILTRKGAVDASKDKWCIIPGSMGAKTYIGRGLGNPESFNSCSHGAGRAMSRTAALKTFTVEEHQKATEGVYCDKTLGVLDETPGAYKDIDAVMESQRDLVEPVLKIKQLVCIKGLSN
jgi:tRNA-splicing ligase RtcB (3'-phosphate/5'-hydroxy nucleic acid ligase)